MGILAHRTEAAPQVPLLATEQNFAAIHGRFKVNILLSNGSGLCYYGYESNASVEEMMSGQVPEIQLDARKGLEDCQRQLLAAPYEAAVLYRKRYEEWVPVSWYVQGEMVMTDYIPFKKPVSRCRLQLQNDVLSVEELERIAA